MTNQQKADEWLAVWRGLRAHGLSPVERDAVIQREVDAYHEARFFRAFHTIRVRPQSWQDLKAQQEYT